WMKDEMGEPECHPRRRTSALFQGAPASEGGAEGRRKYQCMVRNSIGETRIESTLVVTAPLQVTVLPQHQVLNTGEEATFTCNVTGYPVYTVAWTKDQRPVVASARAASVS
ncbi:uncharacterized protein CEXT_79421, partial [Caerostris extrusa]